MIEARLLNDTDYDNILKSWWESWSWEAPSKDMLPENGSGGIMIHKSGVNICAGFLYFTNAKSAWLEFIISNKEYKDNDRSEAIETLINCLSSIAKEKGFKYIYTSLKNPSLIKKYGKCGFIKGDSNCQEMIKIL